MLGAGFNESEMIIGLVGAVGTDLETVHQLLRDRLRTAKYTVHEIRISRDVIVTANPAKLSPSQSEYVRISQLMDAGDDARLRSGDNSILALGAASCIAAKRQYDEDGRPKVNPKNAYIINSLKHPDEIVRMRQIYPQGFYLLGVHADDKRRSEVLVDKKRISPDDAIKLMRRDEDERLTYGQRVTDTFHLSDFFVRFDGQNDQLEKSLWRFLDTVFGHPYRTPTFDEFAMFLAFSASLRSADLSRQVGAVIAKHEDILATGANDCPKFGGGQYWPRFDGTSHQIKDVPNGRDYTRGFDANQAEQQKIIDDIVSRVGSNCCDVASLKEALENSRIRDLTEFGRVVHAEMEAMLACARNHASTRGADLYSTTFPCHNCAKHIIASGIKRVVYIEPYPKSKAAELHEDSISLGFEVPNGEKVQFEPFVGVGPRRFFDLFSKNLGSGYQLKRKTADGKIVDWSPETGILRLQMLPCSYLDLELEASKMFLTGTKRIRESEEQGSVQ
eukprot:TRINITY_DN5741_c0_g1_i11.p1 TRINITY_DN5741_c0_g1~~TRINITY_DN5741_c0_g1_i11.p1  ORF type:complete len:503 (+),score=40.59 TRINITY_DN5741_c0_g1_i11:380-1888(+)